MTVTAIVSFLIVLTVLVFVHEMGHYIIARKNGVRVQIFSIGFGPEIIGWTGKSLTRWKICAIPLGGYVKMFGDADPASTKSLNSNQLTSEEVAVSFHYKPLGQKTAIVAAGPIANFLFAIMLLTLLFSIIGQKYAPPVIDKIANGSAAEQAGLMVGDRIMRVDTTEINKFNDLRRIVGPNPNKNLLFLIERDGRKIELDVVPAPTEVRDASGTMIKVGLLGVSSMQTTTKLYDPISAFHLAILETWSISRETLNYLGQIIIGSRGTEELGGPIRIAKISGAVAEVGMSSLIYFMAVLSINLGLINLFPIPILDGGHLLFYFLEFVRGRPLGQRAQEVASVAGLGIVIVLMVFVTLNDIWPGFWSNIGLS